MVERIELGLSDDGSCPNHLAEDTGPEDENAPSSWKNQGKAGCGKFTVVECLHDDFTGLCTGPPGMETANTACGSGGSTQDSDSDSDEDDAANDFFEHSGFFFFQQERNISTEMMCQAFIARDVSKTEMNANPNR